MPKRFSKPLKKSCDDIYLADSNLAHGGSIRLTDALMAEQAGESSLEAAVRRIQPPYPVLRTTDTLYAAIETLETFAGDTVAVVDENGKAARTLSKGALLQRYNELVLEHQQEATAV